MKEELEKLKQRVVVLENKVNDRLDIMTSERAQQFEKWKADNNVDELVAKKVKFEIEFKIEDMVEIAAKEEVDSRLEDWRDDMIKYVEDMKEKK